MSQLPPDHESGTAPAISPSRIPPPLAQPLPAAALEAMAWLRAEVQAAPPRPRQARLLGEIGEIEEREGDESGAARDYLAAFNADPTFREPLEGLVRLLERRRSFKNLGRVIDAFVKSSKRPDEAGRALLMRAAYAADITGDVAAARDTAQLATHAATQGPEAALSWLTLEVLSAQLADTEARRDALTHRVDFATDPTWKGLLLLDVGREAADGGKADAALERFAQAEQLGGAATFASTVAAERLVAAAPGDGEEEAARRAKVYASALLAQVALVQKAMADPAAGAALGVPGWMRDSERVVDAALRAARALADIDVAQAAAVLDTAQAAVPAAGGPDGLAASLVAFARMRMAERLGEHEQASRLAAELLAREEEPKVASALAMRVAEQGIREGDPARADETLGAALARDPECLLTRALKLDLVAASPDAAAYARELKAYSDVVRTAVDRARLLLSVAVVTGAEAGDVETARGLLGEAAALAPNAGVAGSPGIAHRLGRMIAALKKAGAYRAEATRALLADGATDEERVDLWLELLRDALARGDAAGTDAVLASLAEVPEGQWIARALQAFLPRPGSGDASREGSKEGARADDGAGAALDVLAGLETEPKRAAGLALLAAMRAHHGGDLDAAKRRLRALQEQVPESPLVASYLADLERASGSHVAAAQVVLRAAQATDDAELAAALHLEAGLDFWRAADRKGAVEAFEHAARLTSGPAQSLLRWASRGVDADSIEGRHLAVDRAELAGEEPAPLALERFALELDAGDRASAEAALGRLEEVANGSIQVAADLARVIWSGGQAAGPEVAAALGRLAGLGGAALPAAAAEAVRWAREHDPQAVPHAARSWLEAGGGLPAALEWLAASLGTSEEVPARRALAELFEGRDRELLRTSAAVLEARFRGIADGGELGDGEAARLGALELAPAGSELARRARALAGVDGLLGAGGEAAALSGWSRLAAGDARGAIETFRGAARARPEDLAAWAGLHTAARAGGDKPVRAEAASALGELCTDAARSARFWEDAGLVLLELGDGARAEAALEAAFNRDPSRDVAFDRLFRRVRERKDGEKLLELIAKRLDFSNDPTEIVKLYWERSRVLREKGDADGALVALENVTMVEPDHVGALALSGEIFIRKGQYAEAAHALGRLAQVGEAPAKNRATAGIAAVDLYENKLDQPEKALEILVALHKANLTTLPVRERLARAAAKTGSWTEAAAILEELMGERTTPASRIEAAQLAMAIRRDRLSDRAGAVRPMKKLLAEDPAHGDAIDLLLDASMDPGEKRALLESSKQGLLASLATESPRGPAARRLARVAKALGDEPLEHAALAAANVLGALDDAGRAALSKMTAAKGKAPQIALSGPPKRLVVAQGDDGPVAQLFETLGATLAEAFGPTLAALGVSKKERVDPRAPSPLRQEVAAWAGALGLADVDVYVGGRDPHGVQGVPGEPPALVIGAEVKSPFQPSARGRVARELFAIARGTTLLRLRDETTVLAIVVAACKLAEVAMSSPTYAVQGEVDRALGKAIARKTRKSLPDVCQDIVAQRSDAGTWSRRALATLDRLAVVAAGDVGAVLSDILGESPERLADIVQGDRRAEELLRFVLSPGYLEVRRALGLEGRS